VITDAGVERVKAAGIALAIVQAMADALAAGEAIELRGFGSLEVKETKTYMAHNPRSNEKVIVPPRRRVVFRSGRELKAALRGSPGRAPE
jgi:integration host factor subunit beta